MNIYYERINKNDEQAIHEFEHEMFRAFSKDKDSAVNQLLTQDGELIRMR